MITKANCYYIGKLTKTHGTDGAIIARNKSGMPLDLQPGTWAFLLIDEGLVPFKMLDVIQNDGYTLTIIFEDVRDESAARDLCGFDLYVQADKQKEAGISYNQENYKQYKVIDEVYGTIGIVADFYEISNNPVLKVMHQKGEVLIPFNKAFIKQVDEKEKVIRTNVPPDIIDINFD